MGAGGAKLLSGLDIGPEDKEDRLKKGKIDRVLTSGPVPKQPNLVWKQLPLNKDNLQLTTQSLLEGAQFIHEGRLQNKETLVIIQEKDPDSVVFASAYLMAISGLSPQASQLAITRSLKESQMTGRYDAALRALRTAYNPKDLREAVTSKAGTYPPDKLKDDVCKVYELVGLVKPTMEEINLEVTIDESKRMSLAGGGATPKEERRKSSTRKTSAYEASLMENAAELLRKDMEAKTKMDDKTDAVTAGLKTKLSGFKEQEEADVEQMSKEMLDSLMAVQSGDAKTDLPKVLSKIKKRGELIVPLSFHMSPEIEFDDYSLTGMTSFGAGFGAQGSQEGSAIGGRPSSIPGSDDTKDRVSTGGEEGEKYLEKPDSPRESGPKPGDLMNGSDLEYQSGTPGPQDDKSKNSPKADILFDRFVQQIKESIELENDAYTEEGFGAYDKNASKISGESVAQGGKENVPSTLEYINGSAVASDPDSGSPRYKITIIRAFSKEPNDSTAHVDAYLATLTEEDRLKNRRHVTIIRAYSRDAYGIENL